MRIKAFLKLAITLAALAYPLLIHSALRLFPNLPDTLLTTPPTVLNAWLAWIFGRTLQAGRQPLIAAFAQLERAQLLRIPASDTLPADTAHYTRILTQIWTLLFIAMAIVSALLALSGRLAWWAWFTGAISYAIVSALFFGEYLYRRFRLSHYPHANPVQLAWLLIKSGPIWLRRTP